jgi:hypothetical protein
MNNSGIGTFLGSVAIVVFIGISTNAISPETGMTWFNYFWTGEFISALFTWICGGAILGGILQLIVTANEK